MIRIPSRLTAILATKDLFLRRALRARSPRAAAGNKCHALAHRCPSKIGIERRKSQTLTLSQFQVRGLVYRKPVSPGEPQNHGVIGEPIYSQSESRKIKKESCCVGF